MEPPAVPPSDALRFSARVHTRWSDEDNQSVLNNAVYLTLLEEGRHAYFTRLDLLDMNRFSFLLAQTNVRFLSPGRGGVDATLEMSTVHLGNSSFRQAYRVRGPGGTTWCEAEALLVSWEPTTGASRPMPASFRATIAAFEGLNDSLNDGSCAPPPGRAG